MLTFAIGDIHGCLDSLKVLLEKCYKYAIDEDETCRFVCLGDYVDRGPQSSEVLVFLKKWKESTPEVHLLLGNHEEMFIAAIDEEGFTRKPFRDKRLRNLDRATQASFTRTGLDLDEAAAFMKSMPTSFDDGLRYFVHAGIRPGLPLNEQTDADRLWIREQFLFHDGLFERYIVHGHTPTRPLGTPQIRPNRVALDTGACWPHEGGKLTAAIFTEIDRIPLGFLQV